MARKKDSPQKAALRELMGNYLKENNVKVKDGTDVNSIMRDMMSIILEGALDQELDEELGYSKYDYRNKETDNSRNGHSQKTLHTSYGDMEIDIPRDRKGDFEPQVVKKYQNSITQDMEEKIISMYAKGMTTADIESHMRELYDLEISDSTVSRITDKILPIVKEWQERPLESVWRHPGGQRHAGDALRHPLCSAAWGGSRPYAGGAHHQPALPAGFPAAALRHLHHPHEDR